MKLKKIVAASAATVLGLAVIGGAGVFAAYMNKSLNASNTITVGQEVDTVVISGGANVSEAMYPGDSCTITYNVDLEGHNGDVTVSWELKANDTATTDVVESGDFTVTVTTGAEKTAVTENSTAVVEGDLVFTITMNEGITEVPDYSQLTLSVLLSESSPAA